MQVVTTRIIQETPHRYTSWKSRDEEMRLLRIKCSGLERGWEAQKDRNKRLEEENQRLLRRLREQEEQQQKLEKELDKTRQERDRYKELLFKSNSKNQQKETTPDGKVHFITPNAKKKRGGQKGHKGNGYQAPPIPDETERSYLDCCPDCSNPVNRTESVDTHTIQDIPELETIHYKTKRYDIEKQWCSHCRKFVKAKPAGVIPNSRYGLNILLYIMIEKYASKASYSAIRFCLEKVFGLKISEGTIAGMLHRARKWLGTEYDQILELIRMEQVKHADETGWRIQGISHWVWGLFTSKYCYLRADQSRGKGVIDDLLENSREDSVLVRDDYGAYKKLNFQHQSCWAHLLRESYRLADDQKASSEMKRLHRQLKLIFDKLTRLTVVSFDQETREKAYRKYEAVFHKIIHSNYKKDDTKQIQTRIANQGNNLITALRYENVPLTNNLAERALRPLVITRKISHGSQSTEGAKTHMVNLSVFQSLLLQGKNLIPSLKSNLLAQAI
jgi:transposase